MSATSTAGTVYTSGATESISILFPVCMLINISISGIQCFVDHCVPFFPAIVYSSYLSFVDLRLPITPLVSSMFYSIIVICQWSRNCLPFRSICVHPRFLVGFVLLDLELYLYVLQIVVCPFELFLLAIVLCPFSIYGFCLPLWYLQTHLHNNAVRFVSSLKKYIYNT